MKITCWGARGSIPVCGADFVKYGGQSTCLEVRGPEDQLVILDAGTGIRKLGDELSAKGTSHAQLLFTHAHMDHLVGFPFFEPIYNPDFQLEIICCAFTHQFVQKMVANTMAAPYFPVPLNECLAKINYPRGCGTAFEAGGMSVDSIPLSHPNGGVAYRFKSEGRTFVFMTDNELGRHHPNGVDCKDYVAFNQGADLLVHDAEYTPREYEQVIGYGHSSYTDALDLAIESQVKSFGLFHHNRNRTDDQIDEMVAHCHRLAAEKGAPEMGIFAFAVGQEIEL